MTIKPRLEYGGIQVRYEARVTHPRQCFTVASVDFEVDIPETAFMTKRGVLTKGVKVGQKEGKVMSAETETRVSLESMKREVGRCVERCIVYLCRR